MVQLAKLGASMEWRWGLKEEDKKEESGDNKKESENGPRES